MPEMKPLVWEQYGQHYAAETPLGRVVIFYGGPGSWTVEGRASPVLKYLKPVPDTFSDAASAKRRVGELVRELVRDISAAAAETAATDSKPTLESIVEDVRSVTDELGASPSNAESDDSDDSVSLNDILDDMADAHQDGKVVPFLKMLKVGDKYYASIVTSDDTFGGRSAESAVEAMLKAYVEWSRCSAPKPDIGDEAWAIVTVDGQRQVLSGTVVSKTDKKVVIITGRDGEPGVLHVASGRVDFVYRTKQVALEALKALEAAEAAASNAVEQS